MDLDRWQEDAVVAKLSIELSVKTTSALLDALGTLCAVCVGPKPPERFDAVYRAMEHILLARGEGNRLLPLEWRT